MPLRLTTWNVNGIRNPFGYQPWRDNRTFNAMFDILQSDIVVMQELKVQRKDLRDDMVLVPGWDCYFSLPKHKKGYSGVGIYTRSAKCAPIRAEEGVLGVLCPPGSSICYRDLPEEEGIGGYPTPAQVADLGVDPDVLDAEGRCVVLEFPAFVLFGVYSPANSNGLRDDFRYGFLTALDTRIRNLDRMGKRVVLMGDLNVSRNIIDTAGAEEDMRKAGITWEEYISTPNRRVFNQLLEGGIVIGGRDEGREKSVLWDTTREFHPDRKGMYTHWEQKINARPGNYGSRIDYVLCSTAMKDWIEEADIQEGLMGSDHCPVYAVIKDKIIIDEQEVWASDVMNPLGVYKEGEKVRDIALKDCPASSGKLLPEFDRRRSIRDMFSKKPTLNKAASSLSIPAEETDIEELPATAAPTDDTPGLSRMNSTPQPNADGAIIQPTSPSFPSQATASPDKKRKASDVKEAKGLKRTKSNGTPAAAKGPAKGQSTLQGFFKPKSTPKQNGTTASTAADTSDTAPFQSTAIPNEDSTEPSATPDNMYQNLDDIDPPSISQPPAPQPHVSPSKVIDPIAQKESWSHLLTKKPRAPRCEGHNEPCTRLLTKKKGFNCGREFWMCPRPIGPSGAKEVGTQWRCRTFIWASDWNGSTARAGEIGKSMAEGVADDERE